MGSSTKIDSIAIGITDANNENGIVTSDDLPLGGLVAKVRDVYFSKFWPFSRASLGDQQSGSRWWAGWISNMGAHGTNDSGLPSNSSRISTNGLNGSSSIVPSQSELNSPTAIDQEKEMNTDIAGNDVVVNEDASERSQNDDYQIDNAVVVNEDVNSERSQLDDRRGNAVVENEDVNCERSQQDDERASAVVENGNVNCERSQKIDQTGNNALVVNEDVNCERSQKADPRATRSSKKVHVPIRTYGLRNKSKKNSVLAAEPTGNKRAEKQPIVDKLAVAETAARVEDTEPKESESSRSLFIFGSPSRTARTVRPRRVDDVSEKPKTRSEESIARKQSLRGAKRTSPPASRKASTAGAASGNASKTVDSGHGGTEPTKSGVDIDPTKGRKRSARFHVDDYEVDNDEDDQDFNPSSARRTKKAKISKQKRDTTAMDPSNKASSSVQPSLNENETVPSPPSEQRTEERAGNSLGDQLASEGYIRKPNAPPVNERQSSNRMRTRYVPLFGNPSVPNTGRGLGTGPGAIYIGSSSNQRSTPSSTVAAAQPTVPQKDASTPNTGRGLGTGPGAFYLGSNNNQRSAPPSTVAAAQSSVPQKDASTPSTGRGLGTRPGAICFGSSSNNSQRSVPSSTVAASQPTVPQKDASTPNTGRGLGTGPGAIYIGRSRNNNITNLRSTTPSTVVAAQPSVPQKDASTPNTGRGLGTGPGAIYIGRSRNSNITNLRSTPPSTVVAAQSSVPQKDASTPNTGRGLGTRPGAIYIGRSRNNNITNLRSTPPSTVVAAQPSVPQKDASVSDRKGKGIMGMSNNLPQEVPQKPQTPFMFDLNETYEEDVTSLEENTNIAAREEDRSVPVRSVQNSVEMFPPVRNSYVASSSVMPPPVQESRRSSILFPGYNPQWMGNVPMASPYHHPSPSTYQAIHAPHHQYRAPSPPVWASSMIPPQYHHHHHHLTPPAAPFNMDYPSMFAQAPSSDTMHLSYYGANLMNQAMMSRMDPRFRSSNTPVDHHGDFVFTPRHVRPVTQFERLVEIQRIHERTVFPRTISNQRRYQQRRNAASSSNASASHAENSSGSSVCIVNRYPGEITDSEPYMVQEEDLRVPERMAEFEQDEDHVGPPSESG